MNPVVQGQKFLKSFLTAFRIAPCGPECVPAAALSNV
jgi:hypothetical protein